MFKIYLLSALRNLRKTRLFTAVNILGLSVGMSVCLVALLQIKDAFKYDTFHPYPERTYRIITDITADNGVKERWATAPPPLASKLAATYPFIENTVRVFPAMDEELIYKEKTLSQMVAYTEPSFFKVFGFTLKEGNKKTALEQPYCLVLSEPAANLFFPGENPVGKVILIKNKEVPYTVTGVLKATPDKSHLVADLYASVSSLTTTTSRSGEQFMNNWKDYSNARTYVLLKENTPVKAFLNALSGIATHNAKLFPIKNIEQLRYDIQRLDRISPGEALLQSGNSVQMSSLLIISGITLLILMMACFNYTNLSLARSLSRAKEVGVRKAIGGSRKQVFYQFMVESVTISLFALVVACWGLEILMKLPIVRNRLLLNVQFDPATIIWFLGFALFTGVLAGSLPAAILSSFKPVEVLKNLSTVKIFKGLALRKTLIVLQFGISLIFITFLVTLYRQIDFSTRYAYGFNEKNILNVPLPENKKSLFRNELKSIAGVENISATSSILGFHSTDYAEMKGYVKEKGIGSDRYFIDENFIENMGLTVVAGRNFRKDDLPALQNILLNETAVRNLNYNDPQQALAKPVWLNDSTLVKVVGVVKDFNYQNLKHTVGNLALCYDTGRYALLNIKVHESNKKEVLSSVQTLWQKMYPGKTFTYSWFEQQLSESRKKREDVSMISFLAVMALSIACMGLLGIVVYTSEIRQKEISIRKVMGARTYGIVILLSKNFLALLVIASIISLPVGYMISNAFLHDYAYRITVGWQILTVSVLIILVIGMVTVASQTIRIAGRNPVKGLRTE